MSDELGAPAGDEHASDTPPGVGARSFADLYQTYGVSLFDYCEELLPDPIAAGDAVQDSMVEVDARIGDPPDPEWLRISLYSAARRLCQGRLPGCEPAGTSPAGTGGQAPSAVAVALASLCDDDREVLSLAFRHGVTGGDLAAVLGVPARSAKALLARATARLEELTGGPVPGPELLSKVPLTVPPAPLRLRIAQTALALGSQYGAVAGPAAPSALLARPRMLRSVPKAVAASSVALAVLALPGVLLFRLMAQPSAAGPGTATAAPALQRPAARSPTSSQPVSPVADLKPRGPGRPIGPLPVLIGPLPLGELPTPPAGQSGSSGRSGSGSGSGSGSSSGSAPSGSGPTTSPPTTTPPTTNPPTTPPPTTPPPTTPPPTTPPPTTPPPTTPPPTPTPTSS